MRPPSLPEPQYHEDTYARFVLRSAYQRSVNDCVDGLRDRIESGQIRSEVQLQQALASAAADHPYLLSTELAIEALRFSMARDAVLDGPMRTETGERVTWQSLGRLVLATEIRRRMEPHIARLRVVPRRLSPKP